MDAAKEVDYVVGNEKAMRDLAFGQFFPSCFVERGI